MTENNEEVDDMFRQLTEGMSYTLPLEGVPPGMDTMWIPPVPVQPAQPIPVVTAPSKRKRVRIRWRPNRPTEPKESITAPVQMTNQGGSVQIDSTTTIQWACLGDPKDYVLDVYDKLIAPNVQGMSPAQTMLRQHLFRRAVAAFVSADLRERAARGFISLDDLVEVTTKACEKVGLKLAA